MDGWVAEEQMKKLIINAEDFGFNSKINKGIVFSHQNGIVTCASITVTKEGFQEAVNLAKNNPKLDISIQLDLDRFFNIDHEKGEVISFVYNPSTLEEIKQEIKIQIEKLKTSKINPIHICSHYNIHLYKDLFITVCSIANEYDIKIVQIPIILNSDNQHKFIEYKSILEQYKLFAIPHFLRGWYPGNIDEKYTTAELVTHPGYGELWREYELTYCCHPELKPYLKNSKIELITFTDFYSSIKK